MTIKEIVKEYLEKNRYDGLYCDECACEIDDLMPCEEPEIANCEAGYKVPCPGPGRCTTDGDCDWHIAHVKPEEKNNEQ